MLLLINIYNLFGYSLIPALWGRRAPSLRKETRKKDPLSEKRKENTIKKNKKNKKNNYYRKPKLFKLITFIFLSFPLRLA